MYCPKCGSKLPDDAMFCSKCGFKLNNHGYTQTFTNTSTDHQTSQNTLRHSKATFKKRHLIIIFLVILILFSIIGNMDSEKPSYSNVSESSTDNISLDNSITSDQGIVEDSYEEEYYPMLDEALIGRWRSYDGGILEFDEYGNILNYDFKCWTIINNLLDDAPNYITWEASNGRVNCTAHFQYNKTYEISTQSENDGIERLRFDGKNNWDYREIGTSGEGIVGKWIYEDWDVFSCQFNPDGTGLWNNKYPISWYTYETYIDGNNVNMIEYTIYDPTYFDYQVSGDMLTVFLSDSSKIYTKVSN